MSGGEGERIVVTGLPGLRARWVTRELLRRSSDHVMAIVRDEDLGAVALFLEALSIDERRRVTVLSGDAAAMDLGLAGPELLRLARAIDRIHHVAVLTDAAAGRDEAMAVNVCGAREILELAELAPHLSALVFHSSVTVAGGREGLVLETDPVPTGGFRNPVEESLARAERMMHDAMRKLPVVVARAGLVVGDTTTGEFDTLDGFTLLVLLMMTSPRELAVPLPGRGDSPLHVVPVDYVARASCALGRDARAVGRVVHLVDPSPLSARRVLEAVAHATGRRAGAGVIPANLTKALLSVPGIANVARSPRSLVEALVARVSYGRAAQEELLAGTGITCPGFESYVDVLVDGVRRRQNERRRPEEPVFDPLA